MFIAILVIIVLVVLFVLKIPIGNSPATAGSVYLANEEEIPLISELSINGVIAFIIECNNLIKFEIDLANQTDFNFDTSDSEVISSECLSFDGSSLVNYQIDLCKQICSKHHVDFEDVVKYANKQNTKKMVGYISRLDIIILMYIAYKKR